MWCSKDGGCKIGQSAQSVSVIGWKLSQAGPYLVSERRLFALAKLVDKKETLSRSNSDFGPAGMPRKIATLCVRSKTTIEESRFYRVEGRDPIESEGTRLYLYVCLVGIITKVKFPLKPDSRARSVYPVCVQTYAYADETHLYLLRRQPRVVKEGGGGGSGQL